MAEYYVLAQVQKKIEATPGLSMSKFYHQVMAGNIQKHPEDEGKKRGIRYDAESFERFLRGEFTADGRKNRERKPSSRSHKALERITRYKVDLLREDDIPVIFFLEKRVENEKNVNPFLLGEWLKINKYLYWILFDAEDRSKIRAMLGVFPLKEEVIERLINREITPSDLKKEDVLAYDPGQAYSCYIVSATTEPPHTNLIMPLIQQLFSVWSDMSIQVKDIYALDANAFYETPINRIATECFFSPIRENESQIVWRLQMKPYRLNPAPFIRNYQRKLQLEKGKENMAAILDKIDPGARLGQLKDRSRLQRRYKSNGLEEYLAPQVRFRRAETYEDVAAIIRINNELFGKPLKTPDDVLIKQRLSWLEQNPDVIYVLEVKGIIVGFASLLPLAPDVMRGVLSTKIRMGQITGDDIQHFQPGRPFDLFVWTVGVDKTIQDQRKQFFGTYLIMGIWNLFNDWGLRGIQIRSVFARSDEVDGINTSQEVGFHPVPPPLGVEKAVFELHPLEEKNQPFLLQYQRNLDEYNSKHGLLRLQQEKE